MPWLISILSFIAVCSSYWLVSRQDRSFVNYLTPAAIVWIPANFVLQWLYMLLNNPEATNFAYLYCYSTYAVMFVVSSLVYCRVKPLNVGFKAGPFSIGIKSWILLGIAWALFVPVLVEFSDYIFSPREIYIRTRTGYGLNFFGSALFLDLAFILFLFDRKKAIFRSCAFLSLNIGLAFFHGAKSHLITYVLIWALYTVYVERRRFGFAKALWCAFLFGLFAVAIFSLFASESMKEDLALSVIGYSDYTRNAMMVIDDASAQPYYGRLTLENNLYSRVPRLLVPDKPKNFGEFRLADKYMPEWFDADTGSPAFSIGVQYADFGIFAVVYLAFFSAFGALMAKTFIHAERNPANFLMLLFFSGVAIIPAGDFYYLPEHLLLSYAIAKLLGYKFVFSACPPQSPNIGVGR